MVEPPNEIVWRLRLAAPPDEVWPLLATDGGRASFWAEATEQRGDRLTFHFPNGEVLESRILDQSEPDRFAVTYFDGSAVAFELRPAGSGTDLTLRERGLTAAAAAANRAGWVSVLMNLKARADHGLDLRNHDTRATWDEGYVDN